MTGDEHSGAADEATVAEQKRARPAALALARKARAAFADIPGAGANVEEIDRWLDGKE